MTGKTLVARAALAALLLTLSACSLLDRKSGTDFALRINCGAENEYIDKAGRTWMADRMLTAGADWGAVDGLTVPLRAGVQIAGAEAPELYLSERYDMTAYKFTVPDGAYKLRLHFAETYDGITGEGQRVFSITINGKTVVEDFDPFKDAGGAQRPVIHEFRGLSPVDGVLRVGFIKDIQNPEINAIEVLGD